METELLLTIKDFEQRYNLTRSNVYNRINGLKSKGYQMEAHKQGTRAYYDATQTDLMDQLDRHLKSGNDIATFAGINGMVEVSYHPIERPIERPTGLQETTPAALGIATVIESIAGKLAEVVTASDRLRMSPVDPVANLKALQEAYSNGWLLSSSQLAPLLGLKTLSGKQIERYGFTFTRAGRNGAESAWRISKAGSEASSNQLD